MFCLPDCDPETEFSRLGAETNAFTDYAMTVYYFTCTEHFEDCLRLLLRMASTPYFPPEAMARSAPSLPMRSRSMMIRPRTACRSGCAARSTAATPSASPSQAPAAPSAPSRPELLRRCFDAFYVPSNMALTVMGDVDAELVSRLAREVLPAGLLAASRASLR